MIFFIACLFIIYSTSLFEAVESSLGILILNSMHEMASKYVLIDLYGYFNDIPNDGDFLKFSFEKHDHVQFHFFFQILAKTNSILQLVFVICQKQLTMFFYSFTHI